MKRVDMTNVQESGEFKSVTPGAYICKICAVEDVPEKEYLKVSYDIATGEFAGYYTETRKAHPDWAWSGAYVKSYKTKALPMLKRFCSAVSKSNGSYIFDAGAINSDEQTLVGKKIGLVLGDEEYYSNSGELRTRLYVAREFPIDQVAAQKIPATKKVDSVKPAPKTVTGSEGFMQVSGGDEGVPF